jgi:putative component of membrane protein insertase Oxa1/YidC/SpoIIIJ protein YidD
MAKILLESAIFVESMRLLKCQPIMNHPFDHAQQEKASITDWLDVFRIGGRMAFPYVAGTSH